MPPLFPGHLFGNARSRLKAGLHRSGDRWALVTLSPNPAEPAVTSAVILQKGENHRPAVKSSVTLCLSTDEYEIVHLERPPVDDDELLEAVRWKVGDLIPFPVEEAQLDVFTIPDLDRHARAANWVFVVAARRSLVEQRIRQAGELGLKVEAVDIPEFALRNLVERLASPLQSIAHLLVDRNGSLFCITRHDTLFFSRNIPLGRDDLESHSGSDEEEAAGRLILEVQRSLDYYDRHFGQPPVSRLLVSPPSARHDALRQRFAESLALAVEPLPVADLPAGSDRHLAEPGLLDSPSMLLALGAALRDIPPPQVEQAA